MIVLLLPSCGFFWDSDCQGPGGGLCQIHCQSPTTHRGNHRSVGAQNDSLKLLNTPNKSLGLFCLGDRRKILIIIWSWRYAERIWGEIFILVRRILGKLPANFDCEFWLREFWLPEFFGLVFPGLQDAQKNHAQNSRPELSAFLSNITFLNPKFIHGDFLLTGGDQELFPCKLLTKIISLTMLRPRVLARKVGTRCRTVSTQGFLAGLPAFTKARFRHGDFLLWGETEIIQAGMNGDTFAVKAAKVTEIPAAIYIYRSAFRARAWKCPPECFLGNFGHLPRSAPKSAFWVLFGVFL